MLQFPPPPWRISWTRKAKHLCNASQAGEAFIAIFTKTFILLKLTIQELAVRAAKVYTASVAIGAVDKSAMVLTLIQVRWNSLSLKREREMLKRHVPFHKWLVKWGWLMCFCYYTYTIRRLRIVLCDNGFDWICFVDVESSDPPYLPVLVFAVFYSRQFVSYTIL